MRASPKQRAINKNSFFFSHLHTFKTPIFFLDLKKLLIYKLTYDSQEVERK